MEVATLLNSVANAAAAATSSIQFQPQQQKQTVRAAAVVSLSYQQLQQQQELSSIRDKLLSTNPGLNERDNVNNLALLASLTLQKALNINNINNKTQRSDSVVAYQQIATAKTTTSTTNTPIAIKEQQQRRLSDNEDEYVLNQMLKTGAVFSQTATTTNITTPTQPITIEKNQNHGNSAQKQRLNSSISSTNSTISSNSSSGIGSSLATDSTEDAIQQMPQQTTTKAGNNKLPEKSKIPSDVLDDLASRFIINVPDMELNNLIRICFQIELAHWFYLDFFCAPSPEESEEKSKNAVQRKLPAVGIKQFAMQLFQHIPFLNKHFGTVDQILEEWKNYKLSVPTYGAILVSEDLNHCLLVQSYFARNSWGFPKGKINENEDPAHCATREVYEETGFDITDIIDANDYIEAFINYQYTRLYIVRNIPLETQFAPRTRYEIKCCDWFRIDALPVNKNDAITKAKLGKNANSFFMIIPFVKRLKKWVNERRAGIEPRRRKCSGQQSPNSASPTFNNNNNIIIVNNNISINQKLQQNSCKKDNSLFYQQQLQHQQRDSRRQRHKSMGDLDGIKLNNLNKPINGSLSTTNTPAASAATTTTTPKAGNNNNNNKRNNTNNKQQHVAAGSNTTNQQQLKLCASNTPKTTTAAGTTTTKRQLFHSQSQNDAQQPPTNEKIVSSFDLIRKEKQQQMKAAAKSQKQQQQQQRLRPKSQSDKQCNQQLPAKSNFNKVNNSQVITTPTTSAAAKTPKQQPQTPTTGTDLIAMLTAAAAAQNTPKCEQQQILRPRPASVSLNFGATQTASVANSSNAEELGSVDTMHRLQRMASGTNLRILKRAQSQQPMQQQVQQQLGQLGIGTEAELNFTPNFNSWTNFSFTKNFIANVFC